MDCKGLIILSSRGKKRLSRVTTGAKMEQIFGLIQRENGRDFLVIIRTYERFWGKLKFAIGVFGLKTTAQKRPSAVRELFWSTFCKFWDVFCKNRLVFFKNREEWNGF